jgi:hypothetical protein
MRVDVCAQQCGASFSRLLEAPSIFERDARQIVRIGQRPLFGLTCHLQNLSQCLLHVIDPEKRVRKSRIDQQNDSVRN